MSHLIFMLVMLTSAVLCKPMENKENNIGDATDSGHSLWKRFINPSLTFSGLSDGGISKMRTKRESEECERLALCKLHARSGRNFFSAFQLYFVNKENARLWDHQGRSLAECQRRFGDCYDR